MSDAQSPHFNNKFQPWMIEKARELFAQGESVTSVCVDLDITRETYYQWRDNSDHPFYDAARKGELSSQQYWERLGRSGVQGLIDKFGGSSWQFVMKNRFREHYSDSQKDTGNTAVEMLLNMLVESKSK
jgi:hypothetical protein